MFFCNIATRSDRTLTLVTMKTFSKLVEKVTRRTLWLRCGQMAILGLSLSASQPASALIFNLNYDPDSTFTSAGLTAADIVNMKAANTYAASQFTGNFTDNIHVNITITAVPGT